MNTAHAKRLSFFAVAAHNGTLYFLADDGSSGNELWKSDGTTAGTVRVLDLNSGAGNGLSKIFH